MANFDPPAAWSLDPRLAADTIPAGDLPLCRVLVMRNAAWPWLLLVPRRAGAREIVDLAEPDRVQLISEIAQASTALKTVTACDKLNIGALGNVVAQLHVHVVARFRTDPAWPGAVWGVVPDPPVAPAPPQRFLERLRHALPLADLSPA